MPIISSNCILMFLIDKTSKFKFSFLYSLDYRDYKKEIY